MGIRQSAWCWLALGLTLPICLPAMAGVIITGTRLIYPAEQKEITIKLNNNGRFPALIQTWIDTGNLDSTPTTSKAPFVLSPPVARIDPDKGQSLRLIFTGSNLPTDKESIFWFNLLEIPPRKEYGTDENVLQMAFRSRIKIFYRPQFLTGQAADAPGKLQWRISLHKPSGNYELHAYNPTEFYVSQIGLTVIDGSLRWSSDGGMIGPGETKQFTVSDLKMNPGPGASVEFKAINDYGTLVTVNTLLSPL